MASLIDPPTSGSACELGELCRCQLLVGFAGELREFVDHHAAGWQVDAEGEGLGCEHHPNEPLGETLLDGFFEGGDETGVVARDSALQTVAPCAGVEHGKVGGGKARQSIIGDGTDAIGLARIGIASAGSFERSCGFVTPPPAEDEPDCGEKIMVFEMVE